MKEVNFGVNIDGHWLRLNLCDRMTIVVGDSGIGKSYMHAVIMDYYKDIAANIADDVKVESELRIVLDDPSRIYSNNIVIYDESDIDYLKVEMEQILKQLEESDSYGIAFFRDFKDVPLILNKRCVMVVRDDNGEFNIIEDFRELIANTKELKTEYDAIITEDSGSGRKFMSNIWSELKEPVKDSDCGITRVSKNIRIAHHDACIDKLAIFDLANSPAVYKAIYRELTVTGCDVLAMECFEELLLQSALFDYDRVNLRIATRNFSTEKEWEKKLEELTKDTPLETSHDNNSYSTCFDTRRCNTCSEDCKFRTDDKYFESKLIPLFVASKYSQIADVLMRKYNR